jgi:UDP-N-acetylglucosamine 2-epimerase
MRIMTVLGTRPEWIKLSSLIPALDAAFDHSLVHTGQHYSPLLNSRIRRELRLRRPDHQLRMGSGKFGEQMAASLGPLERAMARFDPRLVLVLGDTNSTLAGALAAARLGLQVVHLEAGCRSGNLAAPEEQNRRLVDSIASFHFAPDRRALTNLRGEGIKSALEVGSTGADAALRMLPFCREARLRAFGLRSRAYALATLHRAENTQEKLILKERIRVLERTAERIPVFLSAHPRLQTALRKHGIRLPSGLRLTGPLGYLDFLTLARHCRFLLSDSGGVQEEAAALGRSCLVLRDETEWTRLIREKRNFLLPRWSREAERLVDRLVSGAVGKRGPAEGFGGATGNILQQLGRIARKL